MRYRRFSLGILALLLTLTVGILGFGVFFSAQTAVATEVEGTKIVTAKALHDHDHDCDPTEWHFVINQINEEGNAPTGIEVSWANGNSADVTLEKFTGSVAHYTIVDNLESPILSAIASIYEDWSGQFNLSHGPCEFGDETDEGDGDENGNEENNGGEGEENGGEEGDDSEEEDDADNDSEEEEASTGSITICKLVVDENGDVTDGSERSGSLFSIAGINVLEHQTVGASTGNFGTAAFNVPLAHNATIISENDAECVLYGSLALGEYFYGEEVIAGDGWEEPRYNDQFSVTASTLDDFFPYSEELFTDSVADDDVRNRNADGHIILAETRPDRTLVVLNRQSADEEEEQTEGPTPAACGDGIDNDGDGAIDEDDGVCHTDGDPGNGDSYDENDNDENTAPAILLLGDNPMTLFLNETFNDPGAVATDDEDGDLSENIIVGGDTVLTSATSTYQISYNVEDLAGVFAEEKVRTVHVVEADDADDDGGSSGGGSSGGSSGGGGGSRLTLEIFNEGATTTDAEGAILVTWNTNMQATGWVYYGTTSHATAIGAYNTLYTSATPETNMLLTEHSALLGGLSPEETYYIRPASGRSNESAFGKELAVAFSAMGTGGVLPSCGEYLLEYINTGADNNPNEVSKLQLFLRDIEDADILITGVYDEATVAAVHALQVKYADDILVPWGYEPTDSTGYVYYTTKKKINEIYCEKQFPLSAEQRAEIEAFRTALEIAIREGTPLPEGPVGLGEPEEAGTAATALAVGTVEEGQPSEAGTIGGGTGQTAALGTLLGEIELSPTGTSGIAEEGEGGGFFKSLTATVSGALTGPMEPFLILIALLALLFALVYLLKGQGVLKRQTASLPPQDAQRKDTQTNQYELRDGEKSAEAPGGKARDLARDKRMGTEPASQTEKGGDTGSVIYLRGERRKGKKPQGE